MNSFQLPADRCPRHVAIIMDGNGRWAKERGLPRIEGHRRGANTVKRILDAVHNTEVEIVTLYAFSVENWNRPQKEIKALMNLLNFFLGDQLSVLIQRKTRLRVIGRYNELPQKVQKQLRKAEDATAAFDRKILALALNNGSRTEVVDAVQTIDPGNLRNGAKIVKRIDPRPGSAFEGLELAVDVVGWVALTGLAL